MHENHALARAYHQLMIAVPPGFRDNVSLKYQIRLSHATGAFGW